MHFASTQFVRRFSDGSHLFRCFISGTRPDVLAQLAAGDCEITPDNDILLTLFHHTTPASVQAITKSGHFKGSPWNVQGTRKLQNIEYAYFTSLPEIAHELDLRRIGMASDGVLFFLPTNGLVPHDVMRIPVYRESTWNRSATIKARVPASALASQHVYRHAPHDDSVYFEICHPEIQRVGLVPGATLAFDGHSVVPSPENVKHFAYVVLGDADTGVGLRAPYDEEETRSIFLIERCDAESIFEFWIRNANTDQITGRSFEPAAFRT